MLLYFGGDYIGYIIDNDVPQVEAYDATVEYLNKHLNPKTNDTFEIYTFQKTVHDSDETIQQFCNRLRSIANKSDFENEDKHIKTQLILGTHSQKKFYLNNLIVFLKEVINRRKLLEEVDKQTVCQSININVVNYEDDNTLEYINSCDISSSKASMQNSKLQLK